MRSLPSVASRTLFNSLACLLMVTALLRGEEAAPHNDAILGILTKMPSGGGYSASSRANSALKEAVSLGGGNIEVTARKAVPSYCSEATYLVFLEFLSSLPAGKRPVIDERLAKALRPGSLPDGAGIWGRWNANGPGTAVLFKEQGLGTNFTDPAQARPGDFLKIFWNDRIGATEHGHSVIFLGRETGADGVEKVRFWSSNLPGGYGEKTVPALRIKRYLFSRLLRPEVLHAPVPWTNGYLSSLERRSSGPLEMEAALGLSRQGRD